MGWGVVWALAAVQVAAPTVVTAAAATADVRSLSASNEVDETVMPLRLDEVLVSTRRHLPAIQAAEAYVRAAAGKQLAASGAFDLTVEAAGGMDPLGYYDSTFGSLSLKQPTPLWGARFEAGYRYGDDVPIYAGKLQTSRVGQAFVGMVLPLWRDGPIDRARVALRQAELVVDVRRFEQAEVALQSSYQAAVAYWKWVGAGLKRRVVERLLTIAQERQVAIEAQVERGQLSKISSRDNNRLVVRRQDQVVEAVLAEEQAALSLSVYWRDSAGQPRVPQHEQLPADARSADGQGGPVVVGSANLLRDLSSLAQRRPDLRVLQQEVARLKLERELAQNERAPRVDLRVGGSQQLGASRFYGDDPSDVTRNETRVGINLTVALPVQQRKARGSVAYLENAIEALTYKLQLAEDKARAQLRQAAAGMDAARERIALSQQAYDMSLELEVAERRKFELGQSNLLFVNAREDYTAEAAVKRIEARMLLRMATALYQRLRGTEPS